MMFGSPDARGLSLRHSIRAVALARLTAGILAFLPTTTLAHEFTAALLVLGEDRETRLAEAVRGFLLAADERDGHPQETSDGHLGGVDVHVLPLPRDAAGLVGGLTGSPVVPPDVVVVLGSPPAATTEVEGFGDASLVVPAGTLPPGWAEAGSEASFVARYLDAYGAAPTEAAALGYHAARRLDDAIRPLDGVTPRDALDAALQATEADFTW